MLSIDRRRKQNTREQPGASPSQPPELVSQLSPVEQLPFPDGTRTTETPLPQYGFPTSSPVAPPAQTQLPLSSPGAMQSPGSAPVTEPLSGAALAEQNTRQLAQRQAGTFTPVVKKSATSLREPVIIRGSGKKSAGTMRPPPGRRLLVHVSVAVLMVFVVLGTLLAVLPVGVEGHAKGSGLFPALINMVNTKSNDTGLIAAQAATATAVTQDGYDQGNKTYAGVAAAPVNTGGNLSASDNGSLNRFFYGQCTYWANMRYHQLTGHFVPWLGNAYEWAYQAAAYGWAVSSTPNPNGPSIVVLQQYVQNSGPYGHVGVVEKVNADGSAYTSNWNVIGWAVLSYSTVKPGPGVSFIWHP